MTEQRANQVSKDNTIACTVHSVCGWKLELMAEMIFKKILKNEKLFDMISLSILIWVTSELQNILICKALKRRKEKRLMQNSLADTL